MLKNILLISFAIGFGLSLFALQAQDASSLAVEEMQFGTAVENRQLTGADSVFSADVGEVYCFTKITGAETPVTVSHVWYYGDEEKARLEHDVKAKSWRTWSSKRIAPSWTGKWRVDVVSPDGTVLGSKSFTVKAASND